MKKLRQKKISEILTNLYNHYEDGSPMKEVWKNDKDTFYVIEKSSFGSESFIRIFFTDDDRVEVKVEKIVRIYEDTNRMSDIILEKSFLIWNEPLEFTEKMMTWEHFSNSLYDGIMDIIEEYSQKLNNQIKKYFDVKLKLVKEYTAETTSTSRFPILNIKITYIAEDKKNNYKFSRDYVSPCGFISVSEFAQIIEETFEKFINSKEYKFLFEKKGRK